MVKIKPFKGIRPAKEYAKDIASPPYDVINKQEARKMAEGNDKSFLHVIKPEIDVPDSVNEYSEDIYKKGVENINKMIENNYLIQDDKENLCIYAQTMNNKIQYGLVACASSEEYLNDTIKKHELTRPDKEEDRRKHVRYSNMNYEPVFFTYHANKEIDNIIEKEIQKTPEYDFVSDDDIRHQVWIIDDDQIIKQLISLFGSVKNTYVADGHHRSTAAATIGKEKKENNPNHTGDEEYNYFLAVHFPDNQLSIIDYNRVVKDLNGLTKEELISKLSDKFEVENKGTTPYKPASLHNFSMYLDGEWYSLTAKEGTYNDADPIDVLDVTILSKCVLDPILDIKDLRKSKRIDFVGGIRGIGELKKRVDSGEMDVAFALYPVTMDQLINIADTGNIMPPKTTWFEPKLRSGLLIHSLE